MYHIKKSFNWSGSFLHDIYRGMTSILEDTFLQRCVRIANSVETDTKRTISRSV